MNSAPLSLRLRFRLIWTFLVAAISATIAQPPLSPDRVTFFTEPNFKGESLIVEAGAAVENLGTLTRANSRPWTFAISSVRIEGVAKAIVHSAPAFRGARLEITRSIDDLYRERRGDEPGSTWDRAIASVSVIGPPRVVAPPPTVVVQPPPTAVVVVPAPPPPPRPRMSPREAEEMVRRAYREVLDRNADPEGVRRYRERLIWENWTERQIVEALQRSPEARAINADEAITRMYREVLGRDPDPSGLNTYRARWRDGWTQGRIRDDLRRSQEGRESFARLAITRAYKDLLGRDPDPEGFAAYEKLVGEKNWTERQIREAIMSGDEYRQRQKRR